VIFPSAEKNFKRNFWNLRGFFQKIGFFVQALYSCSEFNFELALLPASPRS